MPAAVVTRTVLRPAMLAGTAGVTAVRVVEFRMTMFDAATSPTVTEMTSTRFVPVSVIVVPPDIGPEPGEIPVSVGEEIRRGIGSGEAPATSTTDPVRIAATIQSSAQIEEMLSCLRLGHFRRATASFLTVCACTGGRRICGTGLFESRPRREPVVGRAERALRLDREIGTCP